MKLKRFEPKPESRGPRITPQSIAIEKAQTRYQRLECGHCTDYDNDVLYACWRLQLGLGKLFHYCENCEKWVKHAAKPPKTEYPNIPLF